MVRVAGPGGGAATDEGVGVGGAPTQFRHTEFEVLSGHAGGVGW